GLRVSWDPPNELDGRPVDSYTIGYGKSMKTLRFLKVDKDRRSEVLEDVEPGVLHFVKMSAENKEGMSKPVYRAETPGGEVCACVRCVNAGLCVWYVSLFVASESVYVVSLQAQRATERRASSNRAALTKKSPPAEPEEYEAKDIGVRVMSPQSVLISWVDPAIEMDKVQYYTVKYREKGESARWEYKDTTQRRLLIDTLSADGMYEFSVRISQGENHGKWSVSVFQRTPESAPSGPPENFDVKPLRGKGTAVTATWDPPEEPNGRIREYIMSYAPAMKPFGMKTVTYRGSITSAIVDGLKPGDRYIFKIRATNRRGQGPQTKAFSVAMPGGTGKHIYCVCVCAHLWALLTCAQKNEDKTTEPTPAERNEEKLTNEAVEEKKYVVSPTPEEKDRDHGRGKVLPVDVTSNPSLKTDISSSEGSLSSSKPSYSLRKPLSGRRVNSGRRQFTRIPSISGSVSQTKTQDAEKEKSTASSSSSSPSHGQESAAIRKDDTVTNYPTGKNTYNQPSVMETKLFSPTPDQHVQKPQTEAPSTSKGSILPGRGYGYGRRTPGIQPRGSPNIQILTGIRKPGSGSTSQSTLPTEGKTPEMSHTNRDHNPKLTETAKEEEPTSSPPVISTTHFSEEDMTEEENNETPAPPPSRTNPFVNRHQSRFDTRSSSRVSSPRADGKVPWSRTASSSSVGAGRPILRGGLSRTAASRAAESSGASRISAVQETSEDSITPSTLHPLKNGVGAGSLKSTLPSRSDVLGGLRKPITSSGGTDSSEPGHSAKKDSGIDHEEDYSYEGSKEIESKKVPDPTPAPKTTTTTKTTSAPSSGVSDSVDRDPAPGRSRPGYVPGSTFPRRPIIGSNGRLRSPLLTNRQAGSRFPLRAQPAQNTQLSSNNPDTTSSSSSSLSQPDRGISTGASVSAGGSGMRTRNPSRLDPFKGRTPSGGLKPSYGDGKNGRPNLTATSEKDSRTSNDNTKANGQRHITGPDGATWVVDLDRGFLMNENGRILQDSQGRPRRVVLGEDGRTIFDHQGSPLVNQDGQTLFGHGRESQPVVNPKDKFLTLGGKPVIGLDRPKPRTTTTPPTTTIPPTTTTPEPTTLPTTTEMTTEESTTMVFPTCPPETFMMRDDRGFPIMDANGVMDCYPESKFHNSSWTIRLVFVIIVLGLCSSSNSCSSVLFAEVVTMIKDPGAPCSLTEALEYLQVDILESLMSKDSLTSNQKQPPKNKPHNITVVAMEGCHSFVILDWAIPLKDDMVSGYMVHSASYDDVLNNRWSSSTSSGTHLAVENLKPNSRYYFKVQAKNVFGLGPLSDTLTYVTESDDPLLIERPPDGEPIWIPFSFRYNPQHSACKGSQFVKRTWYRKFVGVVLCNSLRYKIFMGDGLKDIFYSIADSFGNGEDHCQFVDSYLDGRTGSPNLSTFLPTAQGYYRSYRQEPVSFGPIGRRTPHLFVGWYECGVPIPGKW
uniref:Fibronectin type-III domain-containing protein n=1 Tax=Esox lucius TaxID=8010 RepID=A0AAY5KLS0_ESOLU